MEPVTHFTPAGPTVQSSKCHVSPLMGMKWKPKRVEFAFNQPLPRALPA